MEKDYSKWGYREFWDYLDKNAPACSNRLKKDTPLEIQKAFANYLKWKKEMREKRGIIVDWLKVAVPSGAAFLYPKTGGNRMKTKDALAIGIKLGRLQRTLDAWEESKHPWANNGQFSHSAGGGRLWQHFARGKSFEPPLRGLSSVVRCCIGRRAATA